MKNLTRKLVILFSATLLSMSAFALSLSDAKSQGLVGEKPNGYLGVVKVSSDATALVNDINAKRKTKYQSLASANKISLSQVEALAGKKSMQKTQSGHYIFVGNKWVKK